MVELIEGVELGPSEPLRVSQAMMSEFGAITGDNAWLHTDPVRAQTGPYGGTVSSGWMLMALIPPLLSGLLEGAMGPVVLYGLDRVRFPSAVPSETDLRVGVRVLSSDDVQVTLEISLVADGAAKPACVARLLYRRAP